MFKGYLTRFKIANYEVHENEIVLIEHEDFDKVANTLLETFGAKKRIEGPDGQIYREIEEDHPTDPDMVIIKFARPLEMV